MDLESVVTLETYLRLLELSFEVSQSLAGKPPTQRYFSDCEQLGAKLYFHAASVYWLTQGTRAPVPRSRFGSHFTDFASIAVIARAALETYLTMFEVFFEPTTPEEFEFRHASWQLQGFILREGFEQSDPDLEERYIQAQKDISILRERISNAPAFQALTEKQQKQVLKGRRLRTRMDVASAAGFGTDYIRRIYHFYSDYAHSGGLAASQMFEAKNEAEQRQQTTMHMVMIGTCLAKQILQYVEGFPEAKAVAGGFPEGLRHAVLLSEVARRMP